MYVALDSVWGGGVSLLCLRRVPRALARSMRTKSETVHSDQAAHVGKKSASTALRPAVARRAASRVSGFNFNRQRGEIETPPRRLRIRTLSSQLERCTEECHGHGTMGACGGGVERLAHLREIFFATGAGEQSGGRAGSLGTALGWRPVSASCASSAFTCSIRARIREKLSRLLRGGLSSPTSLAAASADAAMERGLRSKPGLRRSSIPTATTTPIPTSPHRSAVHR